MENCIFCKIAKGEIPCNKIYEDNEYLAFLDINPVNKGHTLVIPKKHFRWVYDVPEQGKYWTIAQKISQEMVKKIPAMFVHAVTWGEEVHHAHIHLIPRYEDDGIIGFPDFKNKKTFSQEEMKEIAEQIGMKK
ncbi:HIT family protein [Candidatus Woesearchaeota archaeon]|nr:HIT family protein [Candidatus Woesearchaeota archaeon]